MSQSTRLDPQRAGLAPAVVLIDGEHYPPVVRAALRRVAREHEVVAALFLGGQEKLRGVPDADAYGVPLVVPTEQEGAPGTLQRLVAGHDAAAVVDLSDEPVTGYRERFALASAALAAGARYVAADFELRPPRQISLDYPTIVVIGTGKRVGKTAVSGRLARLLQSRADRAVGSRPVVVVAMGRGGPPEPEVVRGGQSLGVDGLLSVSRQGRHAASDHYEDAALAEVVTVGSRRCGGGLAGTAFDANTEAAFALLPELKPGVVIAEGSGSVIPPARPDACLCVAAASQPREYVTGYLGTFRLLISDLVLLTLCEPPFCEESQVDALADEIERLRPGVPVIRTVFRPRPVSDVRGCRVALFTTAPESALPVLQRHLEEQYGAQVTLVSSSLASRPALADAVARARRCADVWITEIKAAAIDVVAEAAAEAGARLVFCDNEVVCIGGEDLDRALLDLDERARRSYARRTDGDHV